MSVLHLPPVVEPSGPEPEDIGTGHTMREVTEAVAQDPSRWTPELASLVGAFFDERSADWAATRSERSDVLADALDRGPAALGTTLTGPVLELGAGTGAGTVVLAERVAHVVAGDLAAGMLERLPASLASRVRLDASTLPAAGHAVGAVVCVNMLLLADEVRRVLAPGGLLVWVNAIGERTPIHLPAEAVATALGGDAEVVASRCGWGTWAVARL